MSRLHVTLAVAAIGLSACGGSDGAEDSSPTSKAEYEDKMEQVREELEPLSGDAEEAFRDGEAERALDIMADGMTLLVDELESTVPPPPVAQAHDDFVASLKVYTEKLRAAAEVTGDEGLRRGIAFFVRELPEEAMRRNQRAQRVFEREGYTFGNLQPSMPGGETE